MAAGAGGCGSWVVQLAKARYGLYVVATCGPSSLQYVKVRLKQLVELQRLMTCSDTCSAGPGSRRSGGLHEPGLC